jgi:hypothetical protein
MKKALINLGNNTKKTFSSLIGNLKGNFSDLTNDVGDNIKTALENVSKRTKIKLLPENVDTEEVEKKVKNALSGGGGGGGSSREAVTNVDTTTVGAGEIVSEGAGDIIEQTEIFNAKLQATLEIGQNISSGFVGIGEGIGNALASGGNVMAAAGGAIISAVGDIAVALGKRAIAIGVGMIAIKKAFSNPFTAIAAGVALVAIGSFIKSSGDVTSGIGGGSSSGGSDYSSGSSTVSSSSSSSNYGGGGSGGGTYVFEIAGTKLIGVLKNTLDRNKAFGGNLSIG